MKITIIFTLLSLALSQAQAECLDRVYSTEHLKKYPNQEIRSILLSFSEKTYHYDEKTGVSSNSGKVKLNLILKRNNQPLAAEFNTTCTNIPEGFLFNPYEAQNVPKNTKCEGMIWEKINGGEFSLLVKLDPKKVLLRNTQNGEKVQLIKGDNEFRLKLDPVMGDLACEPVLFQPYKVNMARLWSDAILQSVRYDMARPTVTSRNLFHLSILLWDIYASFNQELQTYFLKNKVDTAKVQNLKEARNTALSYAAYTFIKDRFKLAPGNTKDAHPNAGDMGVGDQKPDDLINRMLDKLMNRLSYNPAAKRSDSTKDFDAIKFGVDSANSFLTHYKNDGSRESENYSGEKDYKIINNYGYLDVMQSGVRTPVQVIEKTLNGLAEYTTVLGEEFADKYSIDHWQPMFIPGSMDQNGVEVDSPQAPLTLFWGKLPTFSDLSIHKSSSKKGVYFDDEIKLLNFNENTDEFIKQNLAVMEYSQILSPYDFKALQKDFDGDGQFDMSPGAQLIDISPAAMGNNSFASNDGRGYKINPATNKPYASQKIKAADFYRSLAEFWADGPRSETPPGHWNVLANYVVEQMEKNQVPFKWMGQGSEIDREQFELMLHFTLNGALYDAGIVAWGLKGHYQGSRPVTVLRKLAKMAEQDPAFGKKLESLSPNVKMVTYEQYDWELPAAMDIAQYLVYPDSFEGVSVKKSTVTKLAIKAWRGPGQFGEIPNYRNMSFNARDELAKSEYQFYNENWEAAGVGWILAENWMPYQQQTFVTPPFPGFISGHSTFSRAAAEVLSAVTGSEYFPGGMGSYTSPKLVFEQPVEPFEFQWAKYYDAADQSGISRIYGGIHASFDDVPGRKVGSKVGKSAVQTANKFFKGN